MSQIWDELVDIARDLRSAEALVGFVRDPRLAALMKAALARELRLTRAMAARIGHAEEFEAAYSAPPVAH